MNLLVYILPYLPPVISIYLVLFSRLAGRYLESLVRGINTNNQALEQSKPVIEAVALDWGERLGFLNSMIVALFSILSISSLSYDWAILTLILVILLFIPILIWLIPLRAGDLVTMRSSYGKITYLTICRAVVLFVNIIIIVEIAILSVNRPK